MKNSIEAIVRMLREKNNALERRKLVQNIESVLKETNQQQIEQGRPLPDEIFTICVVLIDKLTDTHRYVVEKLSIQFKRVPKDVNGFEVINQAGLESKEGLASYCDNWIKCVLKSLMCLMSVTPISLKYSNPISNKEKYSASSLQARYGLHIETNLKELDEASLCPKNSDDLATSFDAVHYIGKLVILIKLEYLETFSKLWADNKDLQQRIINTSKRNRFLSEEVGSSNLQSNVNIRRDRMSFLKNSSSNNLSQNQSDLSGSLKKSGKPFKAQNELLEDLVMNSFHLSEKDSTDSTKRQNNYLEHHSNDKSHREPSYPDSEKKEGIDELSYDGDNEQEHFSYKKLRKTSLTLARIGTRILEGNADCEFDLEVDDDDRVMELMQVNERISLLFRDSDNYEGLRKVSTTPINQEIDGVKISFTTLLINSPLTNIT